MQLVDRNDWILTRSGHPFYPFDPDATPAEALGIYVIAHALARICRFTGHSHQFYSVAEHSVRVSELLPPRLRIAGLLHDASEAYLGDMAKPMKDLPQLAPYREAVEAWQRRIYQHFGMPADAEDAAAIRQADYDMYLYEAHVLMPTHPAGYPARPKPPRRCSRRFNGDVLGWKACTAEAMFLSAYNELTECGK
jgi:hypothetical protein